MAECKGGRARARQGRLARYWRTKRTNIDSDTHEPIELPQRQRPRRPTLFLLHTPTAAIMSDNGEIEVENPTGINILPKDVAEEQGSVKLFNKAGR